MKPRNVVRLLASRRTKCSAAGCTEKLETSYQARVHAAATNHTVNETRTYKIGVLAK